MTADELKAKYKSSADYVAKFEDQIQANLKRGWLLPEGAAELERRLREARVYVAAALGESFPQD